MLASIEGKLVSPAVMIMMPTKPLKQAMNGRTVEVSEERWQRTLRLKAEMEAMPHPDE